MLKAFCKHNSQIIKTLYLYTLLLLIMNSCVRDNGNLPPVLIDVIEDISIETGDTLELTYDKFSGYDEDGDNIEIHVHDGDNYSVIGSTIIPDSGFIGDLQVVIQLYDGTEYSNSDTIEVSVVKKVLIMPIYAGSWWKYNDSIPRNDTLLTSTLTVSDSSITFNLNSSISKDVFLLKWSNLEEHGITYVISNDSVGQYQHAVISNNDTIINSQLQHMYPCSLNSSWPFTLIKYNITDSALFIDTTVTMSCTDTAAYITVPAGTFKCLEYSYKFYLPDDRSIKNICRADIFSKNIRATNGIITEKIYYADGVGLIQNISYNGDVVIWKKVLTEYYVEETE